MLRRRFIFALILLSITLCNLRCGEPQNAPVKANDSPNLTIGTIDSSGVRVRNTAFIKLDTLNPLGVEALANQDSAYILTKLLTSKLSPIIIDGRKYWVIEGDLLMDKDDIYSYCQKRIQRNHQIFKHGIQPKGLTIGTMGPTLSAYDKWPQNYEIRYCIVAKSFGSKKNYQLVQRRLAQAISEWTKICNVRFKYVPQFDNIDPSDDIPDALTFEVKEHNSGSQYTALSFFPSDPIYKRNLFLDQSYYVSAYDSVGVFRHELGHILGFRHEQIWSQDQLCQGEQMVEDGIGAILINENYDPNSVMHYACGAEGSVKLAFTDSDKAGAIQIYGPPVE